MPARKVAFDILNDIFIHKKNMDEAFVRAPAFEELESRDRGLVRLLVSLVLKRQTEIDQVLASYLHEPLADMKPQQLINVFRIGIVQLAFLETPAHAAVSTTVDLAEQAGIAHHKPLVNAVMRRLSVEGYPKHDDRDAGRINTPAWLWDQWMRDYGVETALDIAAAHMTESPVDFSVKSDRAGWAKRLDAIELPTGSLRRDSAGFVPSLDGFADGEWWVQGAAAALPAKYFGDVAGKTVVDLCAAPGGKTAQLAAMGARVIAVDRSAPRVARLKENMERLKLSVECVTADGAQWQPQEKVDAVLLDAPCSATGTIRHQPDVLRLKDMRDQEKLAALQRRLLLNAVDMLKPGGVLVYCTCSLQKDESEHQATWLLAQGAPVRMMPIADPAIAEMITPRGEIRALPSHWKDFNGIDGFYVARFARI
jgi:16S rRNA (cytosine967-C5)-methyltransferase